MVTRRQVIIGAGCLALLPLIGLADEQSRKIIVRFDREMTRVQVEELRVGDLFRFVDLDKTHCIDAPQRAYKTPYEIREIIMWVATSDPYIEAGVWTIDSHMIA